MVANEHDYICPFCGNNPSIKHYFSDRFNKIGAGGSALGASGKLDLELTEQPLKKIYYDCTGCEIKYEDISNRDINAILQGMEVTPKVIEDIANIYGLDLSTLIREHRTGIVRKTRLFNGFLTRLRLKRKIIICISYNNQRRFVSLDKKEKNGIEYYEAVSVGRA